MCQCDLVGTSQIEAEGFPPLHEVTEMRVAAKQILDELSPLGLLTPNHFAASLGVTLGKSSHCVVHDVQDCLCRRAHSRSVALSNDRGELAPHAAGRREVEINAPTDGNSLLSSAAALASDGFDLSRRSEGPASVRGGANGSYVVEGQFVPESHSVRRGDTLWDISGRYYTNPYAWPQVWALNPQLQNPHWIYPGDRIRLRDPNEGPTRGSIRSSEITLSAAGSGAGTPP